MAEHNDFGKEAEEFAVSYLENKGYTVIARNFYYQKGELDIVALYKDFLVVVEVKARTRNLFQEPYEAVNKKKIKLVVMATDAFMNAGNRTEEVRFDIISVLKTDRGHLDLTHIENAFEPFDAN
ncbi:MULTISPECIES: YraN family protein [Amniculibacterium]|jgi:putative endonuclease|uniref:YraN family protein n=1 Tax=Amniculibacterium TaxID=2715289 RepID=UPI000F590DDA|nr:MULTISPECIES: YraN family protein [Amniculibacterium]